jgi:hypothetical protein
LATDAPGTVFSLAGNRDLLSNIPGVGSDRDAASVNISFTAASVILIIDHLSLFSCNDPRELLLPESPKTAPADSKIRH